jgi:hypothetical protein
MPLPEKLPKLRLVPPETPEELAHRFERETRPVLRQRHITSECYQITFGPILVQTPPATRRDYAGWNDDGVSGRVKSKRSCKKRRAEAQFQIALAYRFKWIWML